MNYKVFRFENLSQNADGLWAGHLTNTLLILKVEGELDANDLCSKLQKEKIIPYSTTRKVTVSDLSKDIILIYKKDNGMPICRLERC